MAADRALLNRLAFSETPQMIETKVSEARKKRQQQIRKTQRHRGLILSS